MDAKSMSTVASQIQIRQYKPKDQQHVKQLFTDGMLFYAYKHVEYLHLWKNYIKKSIQDDLSKIAEVYMRPGGNFWVATISEGDDGANNNNGADQDKVVAMVGLEAKPNNEGELRRMYVSAEHRRYGLGKKLVAHLETWSKQNGFKTVTLSTDAFMAEACKFYQSIGYEHIKTEVLRDDYEQLHFAKRL